MARRPRWVAGLLAILALAGGFAFLAQWQIGRAVEDATVESVDSENPVDLNAILKPMTPQTQADGGRRVTVSGTWSDKVVVIYGKSQSGVDGEWLVRNFTVNGSCLPVAIGFGTTVDPGDVIHFDDSVAAISGRLVPSDDLLAGDVQTNRREILAAADLVNEWDCTSIYDGYVVLDESQPPLETIVTKPPVPLTVLNWLNVFYALEWIAFALFAVYFWFRLVKDAVEREAETAAEAGK
jgi:cytochrome oxidase assembly protein ShyY1